MSFLYLLCLTVPALCGEQCWASCQNAHSPQRSCDQDGENSQGQGLLPHVVELCSPVLVRIVQENRAKSCLEKPKVSINARVMSYLSCGFGQPSNHHEHLFLVAESSPTDHQEGG